MFNLPPNEFDRAKWEQHRGGRNEGNTVATLPQQNTTGRLTTPMRSGPERTKEEYRASMAPGPHLMFQANGAETGPGTVIEGAEMMNRLAPWGMTGHQFFDYAQFQQRQADGTPLNVQEPYGFLTGGPNQQAALGPTHQGAQPAAQTSTQPAQAGSGAPQAIGANSLMTAPTQWGERRDSVMPLQGYQNALLRGF